MNHIIDIFFSIRTVQGHCISYFMQSCDGTLDNWQVTLGYKVSEGVVDI